MPLSSVKELNASSPIKAIATWMMIAPRSPSRCPEVRALLHLGIVIFIVVTPKADGRRERP